MLDTIPQNIIGKALDLEHHVVEGTIEEACKTFDSACTRVVNLPVWHLNAGKLCAKFSLHHSKNLNEAKLAVGGNYLAIHVSGLGPGAGDAFD